MNRPVISRRRLARIAAPLLAAGMISATAAPPVMAQTDPNLQQSVSVDEKIIPRGTAVAITQGHMDMGPLVVDNTFDLYVRDDASVPPVWRHPEDMVFVLGDTAKNTLPSNGDYDFTGARSGQQVWAVPQSQVAGVPWMGWSTQSPTITQVLSRGLTLQFDGHEGPGQFSMFLQSGGFGKPQVLFNSAEKTPQSFFVDLNTHTHANWVFTEPGIHLVHMTFSGQTASGQTLTSSKTLRFAVGGADPQAALEFNSSHPEKDQEDHNSVAQSAASGAPESQDASAAAPAPGDGAAQASPAAPAGAGQTNNAQLDNAADSQKTATSTPLFILFVVAALALLVVAVMRFRNAKVQAAAEQQAAEENSAAKENR